MADWEEDTDGGPGGPWEHWPIASADKWAFVGPVTAAEVPGSLRPRPHMESQVHLQWVTIQDQRSPVLGALLCCPGDHPQPSKSPITRQQLCASRSQNSELVL